MFAEAIEIASRFTFPLLIMSRTVGGLCSSKLGSFVVLNDEGWIATSAYNLRVWNELQREVALTKDREATIAAIQAATSINRAQRRRRIKLLPPVTTNSKERHCLYLGIGSACELVDIKFYNSRIFEDPIDIGVARLEPFDPKWVTTYPVFKDPAQNFKQGTTLCKIGFHHNITVYYDSTADLFLLPPNTTPVPRVAIDGIFTRTSEPEFTAPHPVSGAQFDQSSLPAYPILYVETSTPGLEGQNGGPTVDTRGTVWAIQAKTWALPLDFEPEIPGQPNQTEYQFLKTAWGVHPTTMFGVFNQFGIKFNVSDY